MASGSIRFHISEDDFAAAAAGPLAPVSAEVSADLLTPVAAYLKIADGAADSFLLESVEGGTHLARYSFLGRDSFQRFRARGGRAVLEENGVERALDGDPIAALRALLARHRRAPAPGLPRFSGGAVGYFAYDTARYLERLPGGDTEAEMDDIRLGLFDTVLAFDHLRHRIVIIAHVASGGDAAARRTAYRQAGRRIETVADQLAGPMPAAAGATARLDGGFTARFPRDAFLDGVRRVQQYIGAGDAYQVVLSQRFEARLRGDPFAVYRALRRLSPSPYMFYLTLDGAALVGASPEMLARVEAGMVETRPIAGTRRRGVDPDEDRRLGEELLADAKERAEHLMLLDLGRNDVGRVSVPGSVEVTEFMQVERYSHVMHLVSNVRGRLRDGIEPLDALLSCFPAGTVSGAPKVRAMQIIDELEPHRRGPYAGAVGYIDFGGAIDSCITIRTLVVRDGIAHLQVGAGVVADSVPENEYRETVSKAAALQQVLADGGME